MSAARRVVVPAERTVLEIAAVDVRLLPSFEDDLKRVDVHVERMLDDAGNSKLVQGVKLSRVRRVRLIEELPVDEAGTTRTNTGWRRNNGTETPQARSTPHISTERLLIKQVGRGGKTYQS